MIRDYLEPFVTLPEGGTGQAFLARFTPRSQTAELTESGVVPRCRGTLTHERGIPLPFLTRVKRLSDNAEFLIIGDTQQPPAASSLNAACTPAERSIR